MAVGQQRLSGDVCGRNKVGRIRLCDCGLACVYSPSTTDRRATSSGLSPSVKFAVVALILSVVASIFTILALSRGYERARSRFVSNPRSKDADLEQGELTDAELGWILGSAWAGLTGFLLGFLLVGHIVFER